MNSDLTGRYQAARQAAFYVLPNPGCLQIEGDDRQAFLQRQTTNDVRRLAPGRSVTTVLTSPTARILDVLALLPQEQSILALTLPGLGAATARYLRSRIFFMDKVSLAERSQELAQLDLFGSQAAQALARLGLAELQPGETADVSWSGQALRLLRWLPGVGLGLRLLAPADGLPAVREALLDGGLVEADEALYTVLRVEAGLPTGAELSESYTPLETGLAALVSGSKGCYTGQEVLARQVTYDKVTQALAGLRLEAPVEPGARLWSETGEPAGSLTSAAESPAFGWIGLGVVKRAQAAPGSLLRIGSRDGAAARVSVLPFAENE
ncbi:MAG: YgfZ/GcvT domain-containing protein [Chloroflexota bacterium]